MPPKKKPEAELAPIVIDSRIRVIRGQRVMLDADLAELYGVTTAALNQAVNRNTDRFPDDFAYQLTPQEFADLISQSVISSSGYGGRRTPPWVFTEQGVAMLSGVLRSPTAVRVNIEIMRAFVRMRRLFAVPGDFVTKLQELADGFKLHDQQIKAITDLLQRMMAPPPDDAPKGRFGFHPANTPTDGKENK